VTHSFHGEVFSSARLLLSISLVQLCAAHTQNRAVLASAPSGSAPLRRLTAPPCANSLANMKRMFFIGLLRPNFSHWRHTQNVRAPANLAPPHSGRVRFFV
jgi:hypothetical protein